MELRSKFLSQISHEIRTPLNSVVGISELMLESELVPADQEKVRALNTASHMLLNLVNDILELSTFHANKMVLNKTAFNLRELISKLVQLYKAKKSEHINLKSIVDLDGMDTCYGDEFRLQQILCNLLNNAIKYTEFGEIAIGVNRLSPKRVGFFVSDTGVGIKKESREKIFEEFSDGKNAPFVGGTGLRLSICRQIVSLMDGKIWVDENFHDGQGSVFRFEVYLPSVNATVPEDSNLDLLKKVHEPIISPAKKLNVMVVDDTDMNIFLMKKIFSDSGYSVEYCKGGREAVEEFQSGDYDFILMDLQMPEVSGQEATDQIRKIEKQQNRHKTRIFALTADAFIKFADIAPYGFDGKLTKPVDRNQLFNLIERRK